MVDGFVHLHVHTEGSLLDGHSKIKELVSEATNMGARAVGITDHGGLPGAFHLWEECRLAELPITPIIGCEFYVAPDSMDRKESVYWGEGGREDVGNQGSATHLTVIAESATGLRNLFRLHALSYSRGFYRKPRIDVPSLESHNDGLIVLSGCLGSELQTRIKLNQINEQHDYVEKMVGIFGDRFYIEMMSHGIEKEKEVNKQLAELAYYHGVLVCATNDSHYTHREDAYAHDAMLCLQTYSKLSDKDRFRFEGDGYFLKGMREMSELPLPGSALLVPEEIAERVGSYDEVFAHNLRLPSSDKNLLDEAGNGLELWMPDEYWEQLYREVQVIESVGAAGYILTLSDIIQLWKENGINVGPGRGSAAGSLVCYALGITALDPISEGLLFERFMDPSRVGLPDIDIDIPDSQRDEAIALVAKAYGKDRVARVGTYGTVKAKAAIKDSARVLGVPWKAAEEFASELPPPKFGRSPKLSEHPRFTTVEGWEADVMDLALQLENTVRTKGVHAAGVVVSPIDLLDQLPLWRETEKKGSAPEWITAFSNKDVLPILDKMGLNKYDFLGLKALDVINRTLAMCALQSSGGGHGRQESRAHLRLGDVGFTPLRFEDLPTNTKDCTDKEVYELLSSGHTLGVFQLDSPGMQQLLRQVSPKRFADISAVLALYRPGPMGVNAHHSFAKRSSGRESVSYPHPEFEQACTSILGETYGLIVYQEQVLEVLKAVGGYDMTSAAGIFYAMRKKLTEKMNAAKPDFERRLLGRGYSEDAVDALWATLVPFSDYSFNRSHCAGYGLISYWTAYLKVHYPVEFMCALLSREEDPDKLREYLSEAERMGISILPPDINESQSGWTPTGQGIRYGLSSIKGVGEKAFTSIAAKRPYTSISDFFSRANKGALNTGTLGALIGSGSMDTLVPHREEFLLEYSDLAARAIDGRDQKAKGALPLITDDYEIRPKGLYNAAQRKALESELLGVQLTEFEVRGRTSRALNVDEIEYLHEVVGKSPGSSPLVISFGGFEVNLGTVTFTKSVKEAFLTMGVHLYEA